MVILSVDPGFINTGFSIIQKSNNNLILLDAGILSMKSCQSIAYRINLFYDFFNLKILKFNVKIISLETPFLGKNPQNFLKLGYLRGILYLISNQNGLEVFEFSPREVKLATTGFGAASKEQVARLLFKLFPNLLNIFNKYPKFDLTDSIAIALCALNK